MVAATLANVPVKLYTLHGSMVEIGKGSTRTLLKLLERTACALADRVLAVSHSVVDGVVSQDLCPERKVKVLAHGSCNESTRSADLIRPISIRIESRFFDHGFAWMKKTSSSGLWVAW